ncbi:cupredoxin domain-containing protein [Streptomyces cinnamoneus]|uniref:EfeO-type cupredoxin-like domain-containing protein n=1 Tax=Streptomyces cinnamoneus TaxID=53446 RepID=A0A918T9C1_STRCJ|nr:plastocyanin/azurin family copper-binding protein [Streptomyces cinnamoneus]GHC35284.1 hypothetical protein GCM10010507_05130 [Streptomyces cinnamoneus]
MSRSPLRTLPRALPRTLLRTLTVLPALLATAVLPAGPVAAEPRGAAVTVTVVIEGAPAAFVPQAVSIHPGDSVRWLNNDNDTHTTTSDSGLWDAVLDPGQSFTRPFPAGATFAYHCEFHPSMTGTVVVQ